MSTAVGSANGIATAYAYGLGETLDGFFWGTPKDLRQSWFPTKVSFSGQCSQEKIYALSGGFLRDKTKSG